MSRNPLILDTDGGIDDAQALVMLLAHGVRPVAVTTVFGNVPLELATRNMQAVLALCEAAEIPVISGQSAPLSQPMVNATHVHGEDGLGGADIPADLPPIAGTDAVGFLREMISGQMEQGGKTDLLMIGPLTNLAVALTLDPGLASGIGQLTIMGGTVYGRGNTTPAAEFNIYADPEAADIVLRADIPTLIVPWEPCVSHFVDGAAMDLLFDGHADTPLGKFNKAIADRSRHVAVSYGGDDVFRFVDPFAAAVVIDPDLIRTTTDASSAVALAPGLTRGMTLVDPSRRLGTPPVTFIETGDVARLTEIYAASVRWHPSRQKEAQPAGE
ncbi:nucleoside hydrolase [Pelagovum pacificum]|uniref:Nucleoside hydrolase n=1 Tax=Pelagovum pacificum TaxID=2588711 RepID=A0A5C5GD40_9RHOB|nr:nucleoside hydrolase [Pelagovum pacificum]QQA44215.1 nucleoside hydrolase [Pelagovum pacificum]TNY32663.1 nucleoside hydrolase [Pelagovum pacificum]